MPNVYLKQRQQAERRKQQLRRRRVFLALVFLGLVLTLLWSVHTWLGDRRALPAAAIPARYGVDLAILSDTNRDGSINSADFEDHQRWSWRTGAFMLANVDDDDQDQKGDAQDTVITTERDADDLTLVKVILSESLAQGQPQLQLSTDKKGDRYSNVFQKTGDTWQYLDLRQPAPLNLDLNAPQELTLGLEAKRLADEQWDGVVNLRIEAIAPEDDELMTDAVQVRVAPWLMLPNTARSTDVYIGKGFYNNRTMLAQLREALPRLGARLHQVPADTWEEMWLQDTMEIGYQQIPGHPIMHVVMQANRGIDPFPQTLLGPDLGFISIGKPRTDLPLEDGLVDWMGNLEVTPPLPNFPLGRIYYGKNVQSGVGFDPAIVAFLEAQAVQAPVSVDTSWLLVKHVDEIFSFVSDRRGKPYLLVNNFQEGIDILEKLEAAYDKGQAYVGVPGITVQEAIAYSADNRRLQREKLDGILAKAQKDFNLEPEQVITLPVMVTGTEEVQTLWSNPVNSVNINGTVFVGDPVAPKVRGKDLIQAEIRRKLEPLGLSVTFVDDSTYQAHAGNVHCATNSIRLPVVEHSWEHLPDVVLSDRPET